MSTYNFLHTLIANQMNIFFSLSVPQFNGLSTMTLLDTSNKIKDASISSPTLNDLPVGLKIVASNPDLTITISYPGKKIFVRNLDVSVDATKDNNSQWTLDFSLTSGNFIQFNFILGIEYDFGISNGEPTIGAIKNGACDRLRAVILTSATTIGGLTPLLFETSLQARFIIPMAVTIIFGLVVTTLLVLLVAPAIIAIQADLSRTISLMRKSRNANGT